MLKNSLVPLMVAVLLCPACPAWSQQLPEGEGKELVAAQCNSCHPFHARLGAGYTANGWRTVMRMMINHGVSIPPDQLATMTAYLTKNSCATPRSPGTATSCWRTAWSMP
jgi:virginiamycin B lyase